LWLVKADIREPLMYGAVLAVLLSYRILAWIGLVAKKRRGAVAGRRAEAAAE
jgi:DMSO/TMAO reductase YedYZ heme-binding membrane subunit